MKPILSFLVLLGSAAPALAQGSDSCTTPTPVSGGGPFAFNNSAATAGPQDPTVCGITISRDVWFVWTAPTTDMYVVSTCGGTGIDSMLAVYDGTACPAGAALACNDDSCNVQSTISFSAVQGNSYVVQLGSYTGSPGGSGTFTISVAVPCSPSQGPDVIVGDINGVANYSASGGIDAIALGSTSCNIGTVWVNWMGNNNQHPAIAGNLYRYHLVDGAGRFEQIGISWLKHGFFALSDNLCCQTCIATDGTHLGVGCSDPYDAGLNGTQSPLGPRWQVNAHTGFFVYPPANPAWSGPVARRCEFLATDVDMTPGSRYFGECQYISPDDAAAGNQDNNASWRELSVSGGAGNFNFVMLGSTQREQSAIQAWQLAESGVTVVPTDVPGDGLFHVAYKTTNLGNGQYHYEIAIHNMDADRDGGSFSIPIPAAVTVTNIGFHDVDYRDGDGNGNVNFSGADWTPTLAGGALTWACEPQNANNNANALRWGTTYNFRFDANVAPVAGSATLGLWKPGTPSSVAIAMDVPGGNPPFTSTCFGDGSGMPCPCANNGSPGHGCQNSAGTGGALLSAAGTPSLAADTVQFTSTGELPASLTILLQGDLAVGPFIFGDGLRCAGGSQKRLYVKHASGGTVVAPQGLDPTVSAQSAALGDLIPQGATRWYQAYYRDPSPAFCPDPPGGTFNASNAIAVLWSP
jgi:hypothetical protein